MQHKTFFSFYGIGVLVETENMEIAAAAKHNFSYFYSATIAGTNIKIYYHEWSLPYSSLPVMTSTAATPRNICYKDSDKAYIDYFGKAICVYDVKNNIFDIYTTDNGLANEIIYTTILSRVAELLDKKGMHRIHALGVEYDNKGALILLPCGGGKTSLTLSLLTSRDNNIKLISEDSPLIKNGMLFPFPLRIGVRTEENLKNDIPEKFLRKTRRIEHESKTTIDIEYFSKHICKNPVPINAILVGIRSTADNAEIKPISKFGVIKHCLMNSVIGVGLYQGMEFIMQNNGKEILKRFAILFSRTIANINIIFKAKTFSFIISRDIPKNSDTLRRFLNKLP